MRCLWIKRRFLEAIKEGRKTLEIRAYPLRPGPYLLKAGPYTLRVRLGPPIQVPRGQIALYAEEACCSLKELEAMVGSRAYYYVHPILEVG